MVTGSTEKNDLTAAQADVLSFIQSKCQNEGVPPSYREIQGHFGYKAVGTVQDHVKALIKKGHLEKGKGKARGILPAGFKRDKIKQLPIYGEIAAGATRDSAQIKLGTVAVSHEMAKNPSFALRVVGNSMVDAGIFEGDVLLVERNVEIKNGDIVVALLEGETTVKRYQKKANQTLLIAENSQMAPIQVKKTDRFEIQGKVVGLQRKF